MESAYYEKYIRTRKMNEFMKPDNERLIWLNGEIMRLCDAKLNILSPSFQFGANVFEGIRCYWNKNQNQLYAFRLNDHFNRLLNSIKIFRIDNQYTIQDFERYFFQIIKECNYYEDIAVRQTVFIDGFGSWFSKAPVGMFISPVPKKSSFNYDGLNCCISSWERISDKNLSPKVKVGANYINSRMAQIEALENGFDSAIFMNSNGKISEGPGSCLFIIRNGKLITPSISSSILESITRDTILQIAKKQLNLKIEEREIDRTELYICDEAFLCGSAIEIAPIKSIDRLSVGQEFPGIITKLLYDSYNNIVRGNNIIHEEWLTPIY